MIKIDVEKTRSLSAYEKLRQENITRNENKLKELGLLKSTVVEQNFGLKKSTHRKKKTPALSLPKRASTRKRKFVSYYSPVTADDEFKSVSVSDDESDFDETNGLDEIDSEDDIHAWHLAKVPLDVSPSTLSKKRLKTESINDTFDVVEKTKECSSRLGGIICEYAKSGRSTCRKCREKIDKDAPRVGMQAWIVGRQATTWQCPLCFLSNLTCAYETSGRSKCQLSGEKFLKGDLKLGTRSHTATSFYRVDAIQKILRAVLILVPATEREKLKSEVLLVKHIDGYQKLSEEDSIRLQDVMTRMVFELESLGPKKAPETCAQESKSAGCSDTDLKKLPNSTTDTVKARAKQPKLGVRSNRKGRVEWKFGGRLCYGTLLPSKETNTHCFARTHKGNIKTLAKGKDYWSIV